MLKPISLKSLAEVVAFINENLYFSHHFSEDYLFEYIKDRLFVTECGTTYFGTLDEYDYSTLSHLNFRLHGGRKSKLAPNQDWVRNEDLALVLATLAKMPRDQIRLPANHTAFLMPFSYITSIEASEIDSLDRLYRNYALEYLLWTLYDKELERYDNQAKRLILQQTLEKLDLNTQNLQRMLDSVNSSLQLNESMDAGIVQRIVSNYPEFRGKSVYELRDINNQLQSDIKEIKSSSIKWNITCGGCALIGAGIAATALLGGPIGVIITMAVLGAFVIGLAAHAAWQGKKVYKQQLDAAVLKKLNCSDMESALNQRKYHPTQSKRYFLETHLRDTEKYKSKIEKKLRHIDKAEEKQHSVKSKNQIRSIARNLMMFRQHKHHPASTLRAPVRLIPTKGR